MLSFKPTFSLSSYTFIKRGPPRVQLGECTVGGNRGYRKPREAAGVRTARGQGMRRGSPGGDQMGWMWVRRREEERMLPCWDSLPLPRRQLLDYSPQSWLLQLLPSPSIPTFFWILSLSNVSRDSTEDKFLNPLHIWKMILFFAPDRFTFELLIDTQFFPFIFISWRLITLQYGSGFCHTLTWISHGFTCVPHPNPPSHLPPHRYTIYQYYSLNHLS